jgi:hypothetical protein
MHTGLVSNKLSMYVGFSNAAEQVCYTFAGAL